ncbi:SMI1/KNR4 family protein [Clostridium sporogenes]|uniref:SMI1/KNR4 family protein n=1 Tax=Clostridium sporogenes TaxID=1509 RepID=UPI0013D8CAA4|nr:SMI1/KNR4 family protein [Clostridium sporogenes]NFF66237.1 SMI1/KNR4 family protein [Clostridium sporogenes]NFF97222.1 SMI1/KNR4 family protein [Clostridium sporogenes]NFG04758.1 SMI1/KNR4 family protein [Clostridium sporogenes]NFG50727.1 SMI1/KNR4 family protein [Clostridium sporogenes]NFP83643.1 SMI1/KNR4 family protein [Clostridium sporogenes]
MFDDNILKNLWNDCDYSYKEYISDYPTDEIIKQVEQEILYKLPEAYIELMRIHNGGLLKKDAIRTETPTSWAEDHIGITGLFSIALDKSCSLCGEFGSRFWIEEWEYPDIGVAIADCPSAGHDMIFLDYRECGPKGEPSVVHIDQEYDYAITKLADNFKKFICNLISEEEFDLEDESLGNGSYIS